MTGDVPIERQFHGTVVLVTLHLRKVAHSNDVEEGLAAARSLRMVTADQEQFIRDCLAIDAELQRGGQLGGRLHDEPMPDVAIDAETVRELQACALRLNAADPA